MATKKKPVQKKKARKPASRAKKAAPKKAVKKPAAKKTARKAPAKKKARKTAPKKTAKKKVVKKAVKKAPAKKKVKKTAPKKAAKKAVKKAPAQKKAQKAAPKKAAKKTVRKTPAGKAKARKAKPARAFRKEELARFRAMLQKQLELVQGNLDALAGDNLKRSPMDATGDISSHSTHMADHGTDNFDRELALSLASSRQDSIYDIEDALQRLDEGTYGACEACGCAIERPRLKALPFAKMCMACQNAAERGRSRFRPFGGMTPLQQIAIRDSTRDSTD